MDEDAGSRWAAWMAAAQDGDGAAYALLLAEMLPLLRRVVERRWRLLGDGQDGGEDVVQDILLTLHRVRHTYDPARPFLPWLMAIVRHRLVDAARRHGRRGARETSIDVVDETFLAVEANTFSERDADIVRRAVAGLPPGQRRAVELVKLGGLSLAEASTKSGISVGALKVAVHRAVKTLKGMLGQPE
jgi:RNA polymerase sigma-70 factor, ECF subfamily